MNGGFLWRRLLCLALGCLGSNVQVWLGAVGKLDDLERFANMDPKPFVLIEASGDKIKNRGQGVVLSEDGLVISVGHASWLEEERAYSNRFRISFRGKKNGLPEGEVHRHTTRFADREGTSFLETYYQAEQIRFEGSRFLDGADLGVFKIRGKGRFPRIEFFSQTQPDMEIGETLYLCHYNFPHKPADPFFLINPIEVVGVAQTSSGMQHLAKGYYRVGSSGGAILKNGKLIGIQSSAYTVNAKGVGEIPLGLVSFHLVWKDRLSPILETKRPAKPEK